MAMFLVNSQKYDLPSSLNVFDIGVFILVFIWYLYIKDDNNYLTIVCIELVCQDVLGVIRLIIKVREVLLLRGGGSCKALRRD